MNGILLGVDLRTDTKKQVFKRCWTACSKHANYYKFNDQYDCKHMYEDMNLHFDNDYGIHMSSSKKSEANDYGDDLDFLR